MSDMPDVIYAYKSVFVGVEHSGNWLSYYVPTSTKYIRAPQPTPSPNIGDVCPECEGSGIHSFYGPCKKCDGKCVVKTTPSLPVDRQKALDDLNEVEWCDTSCDGAVSAGYDCDEASDFLTKHSDTIRACLLQPPQDDALVKALRDLTNNYSAENHRNAQQALALLQPYLETKQDV